MCTTSIVIIVLAKVVVVMFYLYMTKFSVLIWEVKVSQVRRTQHFILKMCGCSLSFEQARVYITFQLVY